MVHVERFERRPGRETLRVVRRARAGVADTGSFSTTASSACDQRPIER